MSSKDIILYIKTKQTTFLSGGFLQGEVWLRIPRNIECRDINLTFLGKEACSWKENSPSKSQSSPSESHNGSSIIIQKEFNLYTWPNQARKGEYIYPFSIHLPEDLPGTFILENDSCSGSVIYTLEATLSTVPPHSVTLPVNIVQVNRHQVDPLSSSALMKISGFCWFSRGAIFLKATANRTSYICNGLIYLTLELDTSRCKISVSNYEITLYRTIILKSDNGKTRVFKESLHSFQAKVPIKHSLLEDEESEVEIPLDSLQSAIGEMWTTKGKFVNCAYSITVRACMESGFCGKYSSDPEIELWVDVNPQTSEIVAPEHSNWNPTRMRTVVISKEYSRL
ncbi:unnamed protein product [Blepharisma stoltei]|uniref:Arrestin-like N-terminal domain-containing protein n=1 Tax=Blepharisma stoltei TaxID=1481888 RepID=A0AAU9IKU0_9CILI|nr:unnamed protein product [Blepharisma stoltei]